MSGRIFSDTGPFAIIPEWLLDAPVSDRAVRLYATLGRYADDSGVAHPSRRTLADRMGCSVDSVDRALRELREADALTVEAAYATDGDRSANVYTIARTRPGSRTGAATGRRTVAAQNENHIEREGAPNGAPGGGRKRDPLWDALALAAYETLDLSRALGREVGVAAAGLHHQGVEPDELPAIVAAYRKRFRDAAISASAIEKWAPVLRSTAGTALAVRLKRADEFVRAVGGEYPPDALREELARFRLPDGKVERLVATARRAA